MIRKHPITGRTHFAIIVTGSRFQNQDEHRDLFLSKARHVFVFFFAPRHSGSSSDQPNKVACTSVSQQQYRCRSIRICLRRHMPNAIVDLECSWVGIDAAQPSLSSGEGRLEMKHSTQEWPEMPVKFEAAELPGLGIPGLMRSSNPGDGWIPRPGLGIADIPLSWTKICTDTGMMATQCCMKLHTKAPPERGPGRKKFFFESVWKCKNPITGDETLAYIYKHCSAHYAIVIREVNHVRVHVELCNSDLEDEEMWDLLDLQMQQRNHGEPCASPSRIVQQPSGRPNDETTAPWKLPLHFPHDLETIKAVDLKHRFLELCSHACEWWSEHSVIKVLLEGKVVSLQRVLFKCNDRNPGRVLLLTRMDPFRTIAWYPRDFKAMTQSKRKRNVDHTDEAKDPNKQVKCGAWANVGGGTRDCDPLDGARR